jgi:hypothetical protein
MVNVDERLAAALSRLEAILERSGAAIVPLFHPGIGQPEVLAAFDGIGLSPSVQASGPAARRALSCRGFRLGAERW